VETDLGCGQLRSASRYGHAVEPIAVFGPNPLLTVTVEGHPDGSDEIHLHAGGQGVWAARMAGEVGAHPILCGFAGGETGAVLESLLTPFPGERRLVRTAGVSGSYVIDRRGGDRRLVAQALSPPPSRHELDDLFSVTCAAALASRALVVCNPYPGDALPLEIYGNLVADAEANGTPTLVDLSTPRLDSALEGGPTIVKINDWELAEYVQGPVSEPAQMRAGAKRLRDAGARLVIITTGGGPLHVFDGDQAWQLDPPRFERGSREGCGDSMMGAMAATFARAGDWREAVVTGAAAGAANFLRHGLGTGSREVVEQLAASLELRPAPG
jgi:1-phosphofructokinase